MKKPFFVLKYMMPNIYHNRYETLEEALANTEHSEQFPGVLLCIYNLRDRKYEVHNKRSAWRLQREIDKLITDRLS